MLKLISFCLLLCASSAAAQTAVRFDKDRDTVVLRSCAHDAPSYRAYLINTSGADRNFRISSTEHLGALAIANTNATWQNGELMIPAGDTVFVQVYLEQRMGDEELLDTLLVWNDQESDSIMLSTPIYDDSISIQGTLLLDKVSHLDSVFRDFTFTNHGQAPYPFLAIASQNLNFESDLIRDTLMPGETREVRVMIRNSSTGRLTASIGINKCSKATEVSEYRAYEPRGYIDRRWIADTVGGCADSIERKDYSLLIRNDTAAANTIKHVVFQGNSNGWQIMDSSWKDVTLARGETVALRLRRNKGASNSRLRLVTSNGIEDVLDLRALAVGGHPRFYIDIDTQRITWDGFKLYHQFWLTADGLVPSIIQDISLSDEEHWEMTGPKAGDTLRQGKVDLGELRFKGNAPPGEYPVDLVVHTQPCDTVLRRTIIMTVTGQNSVEQHDSESQVIITTSNRSGLNVQFDQPFTYFLYDLRGSLILYRSSQTTSALIDMRERPRGTYILRIESGSFMSTRKIAW